MYPVTKSAGVAIRKLVARADRPEMLAKFEAHARRCGAPQIGANHVLQVVLDTRYYLRYGQGLQGGPGSGPTDLPRDIEMEWEELLNAD
jgi:hypothetical protein